MALLGPDPSPSSVASLVRTSENPEVFEVLDEVVQFTDGPILTHLAINDLTRKKLVAFLTPDRLKDSLANLQEVSDPEFVALSYLASEEESLRELILDLITTPLTKPALSVFSRLLAKNKLDLKRFTNEQIDQILEWTQYDDKWALLATILVKALVPDHKEHISEFARTRMGTDSGYSAVRVTVDLIPDLLDLVWQTTPLEPVSDQYFRLLSTIANSRENREKLRHEQHLFAIVTKAVDAGNEGAAVVEAKVLSGMTSHTGDIQKAADRLDKISREILEQQINDVTLEGLLCTSQLATVRDRISHQRISKKSTAQQAPGARRMSLVSLTSLVTQKQTVVNELAELLRAQPSSAYGVLSVLAQLSKYPIKPTKAEERANKLRIQAEGKSPFDLELEEEIGNSEEKFRARKECGRVCDQILDSGAIGWLASNITRISPASQTQAAWMLREMAVHQEDQRRQPLAIQGAVVIGVYLWKSKLDAKTRSVGASIAAKILSSVPMRIAVTDKVSPLVVVEPLVDQVLNSDSPRENFDTFEALLALTNLASENSDHLRRAIAHLLWPKLPAALSSEFVQIRRASLEVVCNLMLIPQSAQHFLQHTQESRDLLSLVGSAIICDDRESRIAAAGALAILAEWETAADAIGANTECVLAMSRSLGLFMDDEILLVRVLTCLKTILKVTTEEMNDEVVEKFVFYEGATQLEQLIDTVDPVGQTEVAKRTLQCIKLIAEYRLQNKTH